MLSKAAFYFGFNLEMTILGLVLIRIFRSWLMDGEEGGVGRNKRQVSNNAARSAV
jgi:hypothetical protein